MQFLTLLFVPYITIWLLTRSRRAYRWLLIVATFTIQLFAILPMVILFIVVSSKTSTEVDTLMLAGIYKNYQVTNASLHGLDGWQGVDLKSGCGEPIYAPFAGTVTYNGLDGYNHLGIYEQSTMLTIKNDDLELTLLHGDYLPQVGSQVRRGEMIGTENTHGWSTGCHSHVILKQNGRTLNYLDWMQENRVYAAGVDEYQHKTGDMVQGFLSGYDKEPTDQTIANRQRWGQIPSDLSQYDAYIAVLDCNRIGQTGTLRTQAGILNVLIFDCAGIADGGANWMMRNNYVAELDYYSRIKYQGLMGTTATLEFGE